jgi:crotonobetainyl-CoA:carnitine CoA-transferase CaiB-like acyl-CoA transferase
MAEAPYNVYRCSDGWIALLCVSEKHWQGLLDAMGRLDLLDDAKFKDLQARVDHIDELDDLIEGWTSGFGKDELIRILTGKRIPCAPVRELDEVVNDSHMHERGTLKRIDHPELGEVVLPTGPMIFPGTEQAELVPSKGLGADNEAVYIGWLGLDPTEFQSLQRSGAI